MADGPAKEAIVMGQQDITKLEGKEPLSRQQKLIRIADRSEYGWVVMDEYDLAVDSDDGKRLEKAKWAA